jgi:acyl dehydratase
MRTVEGMEGLRGIIGETLGPSEPITIDKDKVRAFAEVTGDHQWIHLDEARAKATPFGGTIAHGYLVLSLVPPLLFGQLLTVAGVSAILNYGADKLRFPDVVRVGSQVRLAATLEKIVPRAPGELATFALEFTATGAEKPCCVAQILLLFLP